MKLKNVLVAGILILTAFSCSSRAEFRDLDSVFSKSSEGPSVAVKGMVGVEHHQADGRFVAYLPRNPTPLPIQAGDRLRARLETADKMWIYAVAVAGQANYWKLGAWASEQNVVGDARLLWPGGHSLSADEARMTTLFIVSSPKELLWLRDLTRADCGSLVNQNPRALSVTQCDHLYALFWKTPPRPRGMVPPRVEFFQDGETRLPAVVAERSDLPYAVLEWQFQLRNNQLSS